MQSVAIITNVVRSNPDRGEVHSIQQYVIKFGSDIRQVSGFLRVFRFPPPYIKSNSKATHTYKMDNCINMLKGFKIVKRYSEAVNRRTDNTMNKPYTLRIVVKLMVISLIHK